MQLQMIEPRRKSPNCQCWHLTADQVDSYAMAKLSPEECAPVEEHLLYCLTCQDALLFMDEFIESLSAVSTLHGSRRLDLL